MKAFKFRLQTPLDIAERQEQMAREELSAKIIGRDNLRQELNRATSRLNQIEELIRNYIQQRSSLQKILLVKEFIPVLHTMILDIDERLKTAEHEVDTARDILVERIKETKTLKKLKEQEWQVYLQEWNREEQNIVDEIAISRYYRKNIS